MCCLEACKYLNQSGTYLNSRSDNQTDASFYLEISTCAICVSIQTPGSTSKVFFDPESHLACTSYCSCCSYLHFGQTQILLPGNFKIVPYVCIYQRQGQHPNIFMIRNHISHVLHSGNATLISILVKLKFHPLEILKMCLMCANIDARVIIIIRYQNKIKF